MASVADAILPTAAAAATATAAAATATNILTATGGSSVLSHLPTPTFLKPILHLNTFLLSTPAHSSLFPFPWMFVLHAIRCSFAWRAIIKANTLRAGGPQAVKGLTWSADAFGFLLMSWGGGLLSHAITGQVPPPLLSAGSALTYLPIHAAISLFLSTDALSAFHPSGATMDILMSYIDGATRAGAVALGVNLASAHSPSSLLLQVGLGTLTACGGGQSCGTLGTWNPNGWTLSTPPALAARTVLEGIDVWAPLLATIAYIVLGGTHEDVLFLTRPVLAQLHNLGLIDATSGSLKGSAAAGLPVLHPTSARALATLIIASAFTWRAAYLHGSAVLAQVFPDSPSASASTKSTSVNGKSPRKSITSSAVVVNEKTVIASVPASVADDDDGVSSSVAGDSSNGKPVRRSARRKT
ncbi:hypothetical protein OC846_004363 [Tilletia horrida]|uniref:Uncharacterized protein n=1 Tax=Tilletia horrida TaxID=155126 RepID=A0AAN6GNB6_9BASI|nr:hypothetical protein OC845_003682 [Tilletia horrida]KAK0548746.1 hypothetical protein OC846_004363 [Tilletia horrida]KAK0563851.1 hypothetical protein OC861_004591 [Tilletia horrida]